jgi:hypothetical protein
MGINSLGRKLTTANQWMVVGRWSALRIQVTNRTKLQQDFPDLKSNLIGHDDDIDINT